MKALLLREMRSQSGFTLVELLVASAIGVIVMTALSQVVLTAWRAGSIATERVAASGQVRNFEFVASDDFALANVPATSGCGASAATACTTQTIVLDGFRASNSTSPTISPYHVTYAWDGTNLLYRQIGNNAPREAAYGVSAFAWYVDAANQTVVVSISVKVQSYTETQTLRFYPHVNP